MQDKFVQDTWEVMNLIDLYSHFLEDPFRICRRITFLDHAHQIGKPELPDQCV